MEWSGAHSLITPAGTITFNASTGDTYLHDPNTCVGLDGSGPLRTARDPRPLTDGSLQHPSFLDGRTVTIGGTIIIRSASTEAAVVTARNTMEDALSTALDSILNTTGVYQWVLTGGSTRHVGVRYDSTILYSGAWLKSYLFGLFCPNPQIY